jgi:hypothetical protein
LFSTPEEEEAMTHCRKPASNYFLFSKDSDPPITAPLLSPELISQYLGIHWTDGAAP